MKSNNFSLRAIGLLLGAALIGVAILDTVPLYAQDADIKEQLQGVDLTGVKQLRLSPNGELAAGLTGLYDNPGPRSGSFSLIKIWSIGKKELVHEFRVPGEAYEVVFSADGSTVIAADRTGNLGYTTTIRAWDLAEGTEWEVGTCGGEIDGLRFSPDGSRLSAVAEFGYFSSMAARKLKTEAIVFQINVWQINGEGNVLSINIPDPLGEWVEMWPPINGWSEERKEAASRRVVPKLLSFNADGKQLICETEAGLRTIYDSRTGRMLQHSNMSSVGLFKSMLMIAMHQVPADVKSLTFEIAPVEKAIRIERSADGWWRAGTDEKSGFKVDGEQFVSLIGGVETKEHILMRLGLKDDTNLAEFSSFRHPLGVIKINRGKTGLKFRLEEVTDGTESGETLQSGEVQWAPTVNK